MGDIKGPVSTLPGSINTVPVGTMCDHHPDCPADFSVQGETDSFGAEFHFVCQECYDDMKESIKSGIKGQCEYCKTKDVSLFPFRDYDEGLCGPVYYICAPCKEKEIKRLNKEMENEEPISFDDMFDED